MPWQRQVADVAFEVDDRGLFVYPLVIVSVPRQSGKTTIVLANGVHRSLLVDRAKCWHTAQTGNDARTKWLEMAEVLERSPLAPLANVKRGVGHSRMIFRNGSQFRPHPPTIDALHGEQSDVNNIDEAWSFDAAQGAALMQAIVPTQATRPGAQTIITSTMGTADSTWFHDLVDRGRAGEPGIAYFEWSIADDVDPTDLDAVCAAHPAYGYTIDREAIERAANQLPPGEFARAYGNRRTATSERVIPADAVEAALTGAPLPAGVPSFAAAVAIDRSETAIIACVVDDAGIPWAEVIDARPGTSWAVDACEALTAASPGTEVVVDAIGPSGPLADQLDVRGVPVVRPRTLDVAASAADLFDRFTHTDDGRPDPRIRVRPDPALTLAFDSAARRTIGDGAWTWGRRHSTASIASLEALTLAVWHRTRTRDAEPPRIVLG